MLYEQMKPHHAPQVANIHIEGQPGTLLTRLGRRFLTRMYEEIVRSEWGFGIVALEGDTVAGAGVLTTSTRNLFRDIKRRRAVSLVLALLPQLFTHPHLLLDVYQSWRYPAKMGGGQQSGKQPAGEPEPQHDDTNPIHQESAPRSERDSNHSKTEGQDAEFLFLGVRKAYRGQKIASGIFDASVGTCHAHGVNHLTALVEHSNWRLHQVASYHVARFDWRRVRQLELNGRLMDVIEIDLSRELPPESWGNGTLDETTLPDELPGERPEDVP